MYGSEEGKVMSIKDFTEDELNIVYSSFIFRGMSKIEISAALSRCAVLQFCRDEIIRDETSFEKSLGIVVSGRCRAMNRCGNKTVLLNCFSCGGVFGAASLFDDGAGRYASVIIADTDCTVLFFGQADAEKMICENSAFALNYVKFLSSKIRFLNGKISGFTSKNAADKLLEYLKSLPDGCGEGVELKSEYAEIAEILGIGRASLYRAFDKLCGEGIIVKKGKKIIFREEVLND